MAEALFKAGTPEWHDRRRQGITATDITVIAGLVSWDSPWALYHRKRGDLPEVEQSDRMRLGSWLEEHIIQEWADRHWMENGSAREHLLYASEARPWQLATPDLTGHGWTLEVKATSSRDGWGDAETDQVPPRVRAQVLWQMDTLNVAEGHVAVVFLPSGEFRSYTIRHHPQNLAEVVAAGHLACDVCKDIEQLRELGRAFQKRIMDGDPPPVDGLTVTTDALKRKYPGGGASTPISPELLEGYDLSAQIAREAKQDHTRVVNEIRAVMGDSIEAVNEADGTVAFRRVFTKVQGYTVDTYERDTIRRVKAAGDD